MNCGIRVTDGGVTVAEFDVSDAVEAMKLVAKYEALSKAASNQGWPECVSCCVEIGASGHIDPNFDAPCDACVERDWLRRNRKEAIRERAKVKRKMLALARAMKRHEGGHHD